jgi:superfamily II DNA or RNA helicase
MIYLSFQKLATAGIGAKKIEADLTYKLDNYANPKKKKIVCFFERVPGGILVPRFYAQKILPTGPLPIVDLKMTTAYRINGHLMETKSRPQQSVFKECLSALEKIGGSTIILPCGSGKTNVAIALAARLGVKTAVLCHQNFLLGQWKERLEEFLIGDTKKQVRIGRLQQSTIDTKDKDFVLCSIPSILSRSYPVESLRFGLVIVDEVHHIAAPTFSRALSKLEYQFSLGLTATPKRKDKLEEVIYYFVGPPCCEIKRQKRKDVQVTTVTYAQGPHKVVNYGAVIGISKMITYLTIDQRRNAILIKIIENMEQIPGRKGLLLSGRVAHLQALHETLGPERSAIISGKINTDPSDEKNGPLVFNKFITLSTFHQFSEAVDFPGDFVILATPRSNVEQCTGRILRGKNKHLRPVIIDVIDPFSVFFHMAKKRRKYYVDTCGYELVDVPATAL